MLIDNRKAMPHKNRVIRDQTFLQLQNKFGFKHFAERDYYNFYKKLDMG
jgi:hypothetical protein